MEAGHSSRRSEGSCDQPHISVGVVSGTKKTEMVFIFCVLSHRLVTTKPVLGLVRLFVAKHKAEVSQLNY